MPCKRQEIQLAIVTCSVWKGLVLAVHAIARLLLLVKRRTPVQLCTERHKCC
ncbi:hypothetical protein BDR03DRAFT_975557 [Suillus americanus]|nr:hypothetical protein BDR03DRAFT_975557 [Suillus americanus]